MGQEQLLHIRNQNFAIQIKRTQIQYMQSIWLDKDEKVIPSKIIISSFSLQSEGSKINLLGFDKSLIWEKVGNGLLINIPTKSKIILHVNMHGHSK